MLTTRHELVYLSTFLPTYLPNYLPTYRDLSWMRTTNAEHISGKRHSTQVMVTFGRLKLASRDVNYFNKPFITQVSLPFNV